MRMWPKLFPVLVALTLAVGLCPVPAFAASFLAAQGDLVVQVANPYPPYNYYNSASDYQISCTWYAWQQAHDRLGIDLPDNWGNGGQWYDNARAAGYSVGSTPQANSLAVYNGYDAWGHVEFVTAVSGSTITVNTGGYNPTTPPGTKDGLMKSGVVGQNNLVGYVYLTSNDKSGPSYSDFHVGEINSSTFTVMAKVTDPGGIGSVRYAVWTDNNGQDDIVWYDGHCTDGNDYYWARVPYSEHNGEKGRYTIHMYAYDSANNLTNPGIAYDFSTSGPVVSDFHVGELREGAFTVMAKVTDPNGVGSVRYAIWTEKDGQDDLQWYNGNHTDNNGYFWARVNFSDHKGEKGNYTIHLYAYDTAGTLTNPGLTYYFENKGPEISDVAVSDVTAQGYTVHCRVADETGVTRVQFPTWTLANDQDDLIADWTTNVNVRGTPSGDIVVFRVNTADHNGETGAYRTHIYAYDTLGNQSTIAVPDVNVHNHRFSESVKAATFTEDGSITRACSICGEIDSITEIPKISEITPSTTSFAYNGQEQRPSVAVKDRLGMQVSSNHYAVTYSNPNSSAAGSYSFTVSFNGWYSGSKTIAYEIANQSTPTEPSGSGGPEASNLPAGPADSTDQGPSADSGQGGKPQNGDGTNLQPSVSVATVTNVNTKTYTGKALTQNPAVTLGETKLRVGVDYDVSYANNIKVGTATMRIAGKGGYAGAKHVTFVIAKANVKNAAADRVKAQKHRKGKAITPNPKLTYMGKKLKKGTDYTLKYKNNKKRGTATITVKGVGNFKGSKTIKFKIK